MSSCIDTKSLVPISKVVSAAIVDLYEDGGKAGIQQTYYHWAARGLLKLSNEVIRLKKQKALLRVNKNTWTATLPLDFKAETFVGFINRQGRKVPMKLRSDMIDMTDIVQSDIKNTCVKCGQDNSTCKDFNITESTEVVIIDGITYERTITKRLYSDGSYYLETEIPIKNETTGLVEYITQREFIARVSLKPCGCIEQTEENLEVLKCIDYTTYCDMYCGCDESAYSESYQIFEDTGLIKVNKGFKFDDIYIEYKGYIPKKNGQYHIPEVAFETLVEFVKYKSVENRKSVSIGERSWYLENYKRERRNMEKSIGSVVTINDVIQAALTIPKFDYILPEIDDCCSTSECTLPKNITPESTGSCGTSASPSVTVGGSSVSPQATYQPFSIAVVSGIGSQPIIGTNVFQDDRLKSAIGVSSIIVNNRPESSVALEYTIDTVNGTITRFQSDGVTPQNWQNGDVLVIPVFFKLV